MDGCWERREEGLGLLLAFRIVLLEFEGIVLNEH